VPTRSITIGSWFSDCIGASSLARRSRIMRVASHQIKVISTHQKIGHSPSITTSEEEKEDGQPAVPTHVISSDDEPPM
jgi:hypothetical protein